jgi:hypothetical protein
MRHGLFWLLLAALLFRAFVLGYLSGSGSVDPTFFTYQNFTMCMLALLLLILSLFKRWTFEVFALFGMPFYWGTTLFVSVAIVVIVHLNGGVFMKTTLENGGLNPVGKVHTGDWLLHQWPSVELLLSLFLLKDDFVDAFHDFYDPLSRVGKALYTLYFLLVALAVLTFYMINFPFLVNYPTSISDAGVVALVVAMALLVEVLLFLLFYLSKPTARPRRAPIKG